MARPVEDDGGRPPVDALRGVVAKLRAFPPMVRHRGQEYARSGRVGRLIFEDDAVRAKVHGSRLYDAAWSWGRLDASRPACSCPVGPYCKHAYALACCLLAAAHEEHGFVDPRLAQFLPAGLVPKDGAVVPIASGGAGGERRREAAARTSSSARSASAPSSTLERLRAAPPGWQREHALERLLAGGPARGLSGYLPPFPEILEEEDPDLMCWRLAQEIQTRAEGWLPRELGPYRDRPDLAARHAERARAELLEELASWARRRAAVTPRSLRLLFGLVDRPGVGPTVTVEARVTSTQMNDEPRSLMQLVQLRTQVHRTPGVLPADQAAALDWLCDHNVGGRHDYYAGQTGIAPALLARLLERVTSLPFVAWRDDIEPGLAAAAGVRAGDPVRLGGDLVRYLPASVTREGEVWVDLRFVWPDGREHRREDAVYLRDPGGWSPSGRVSLVLADGAFWVVGEEPPESVVELFAASGGLPLPEESRAETLGLLATSFPHLEASLVAHTRTHAVTPIVALDLRADDWIQLRVFARAAAADAADVAFEYLPEGRWARCPRSALPGGVGIDGLAAFQPDAAPPGAAAADHAADAPSDGPPAPIEVWLDVPRGEDVAPLVAWLEETGAAAGARRGPGGVAPPDDARERGWWIFCGRRRMERFADVWEMRPPGVDWYGSERARRLLAGAQRVAPRVRIEASGVDWFKVSAAWEAEGRELSDADLAKLRAAMTRFVKLDSGWVRRDVTASFDEMSTLLADLGLELGDEPQQVTVWQLAGADPESLASLERLGTDAETLAAARTLRERVAGFTGLPTVTPPSEFTGELRPYQQAGFDFLAHASSLGVGAILADDMGLGKTVQALAWLTHLRRLDPLGGPSLVACPASVVHNWAREAERFAPSLRVLLLTSGEGRHAAWNAIADHDLVVTNYALLRRDAERWRAIDLRAVILDEAQNIKNPSAAVTRAATALRARHRLALTGTPLENRALDLWSIASFVNPGYLGNRTAFGERYDGPEAPPYARTLLSAKLRPMLLRRTKRAVAPDLPPRIEERRDCELTKGQRHLYLAELRRSRALVEALAAAPGGVERNKITVLAALTRLRQICCHPALAGGDPGLGSGKVEALVELLEPLLAEGHKVLVFSQFVSLLKLLQPALAARGVKQHFLSGQTQRREQVVAAFQNDPEPCVFLVSLKAGGTGLNLTAASYVVLFDPWWNPAVEAQAIDRSHRIGQDQTVIAYRLLVRGTIEEKIWELQQRKAALSRELLGEDGFARALDRDALQFLLEE
ncbi:MAG: DEAD/DEAH box helicase [Deltaproteobacteria bacterium]|nr:DEAD/DEAH box helicase [Deltaproteobacteria bacterium]